MGKRSDRRRRDKQRARERVNQARRRTDAPSPSPRGRAGPRTGGLGGAGRAGARGRSAAGAGSDARGWGRGGGEPRGAGRDGPAFTPDLVDTVIDTAVSSCRARDAHGLDNAVTVLVAGPAGGDGVALVDRALGRHLVDAVGNAWGRGWQPADLARVAERELGRAHGRLVATAIVRETRRYEPTSVPGRWRSQVDDLDPGGAPSGAASATDDSRWAVTGQTGERRAAVRAVVEALTFIGRLPDVPKLGPAPGDASATADERGATDPRILHRVRSLLAKAESTTFPDEAEALTAKAQELMARHAIDGAVIDAERGSGPQVGGRRVAVDDPYAGPKAMLLEAISSANRSRSVWSKGFGYATVFGTEGDLDAVELLYTSLLVQAARAMFAEGVGPTGAGGRTRSFRQSFLVAFSSRIGERLRDAVDTATDAYADQHATLLPVLASRREAAEAACDETFPKVRSFSASANDWWGWRAGNEAAEAAQLDVHTPVGRGSR
jgi:hypothetical protein